MAASYDMATCRMFVHGSSSEQFCANCFPTNISSVLGFAELSWLLSLLYSEIISLFLGLCNLNIFEEYCSDVLQKVPQLDVLSGLKECYGFGEETHRS